MDVFKNNLEDLKEYIHTSCYKLIKASKSPPANLKIIECKNNKIKYTVFNELLTPILLHSIRSPEDEALRQIISWTKAEQVDWSGLIVLLGIVGPYYLELISKLIKQEGQILVIDTSPDRFKHILKFWDIIKIIPSNKKLSFIVSDDEELIKREYRLQVAARNSIDTKTFCHPGLFRAFPKTYSRLLSKISTEQHTEKMERNTIAGLSNNWLKNSIKNLPYLLTNPDILALNKQFDNKPAFVIAAGPSLDKSIKIIKQHENKVIIIAVGTALLPLLQEGIEPDFVIALDWNPKTLMQFNCKIPKKSYLLTEKITCSKVINLFKNKIFSFSSRALTEFALWLKTFNALPGELSVGGTVSLSAIDAAQIMGCNPIIIFGLDLSFPEDGTTHAKKSMYNNQHYSLKGLMKIEGNYEQTVYTTKQFFLYIHMLESYLIDKFSKNTIYNANTGGAKIKGFELIHPDKIVKLLSIPLNDKTGKINKIHSQGRRPSAELAVKAQKEIAIALCEVIELTDRAVQICNNTKERKGEIQKTIKELDEIDSELKEKQEAMLLVNCAIKALSMKILDRKQNGVADKDFSGLFYKSLNTVTKEIKEGLERSFNIYQSIMSNKGG